MIHETLTLPITVGAQTLPPLCRATRVARDIQFQALMEIWLYFHVPLSFALLAALTGHILVVFFYW